MTARAFFETYQIDGRAVLSGPFDDPRIWIVEVDRHLLLCERRADDVRWIADATPIAVHRRVFSRRQFPPCRCWFCARYDRIAA